MDAAAPLPSFAAAPPDADARKREQIKKTAQDFEAAFLGQMLKSMFEGVETSAPFGGGPGESAFKSFLTEAVAKQMSAAGGVGLADDLQRQMLKMQGLE
jgi:Rod binding domain-containing protein